MTATTLRLPEFDVARWVNSPPLTPAGLRGKVVLVDFWEYTCVNWIRTSPYLNAWHRDYADAGLAVVGMHAPEFEFGKSVENIERGVRDHGLRYPVALDNDFAVWRAVDNFAWPAKYLFDAEGGFVDRWIGEGAYDAVESEIRRLLAGADLPPVTAEAATFAAYGQPSYAGITEEMYLGVYQRVPGAFVLDGEWESSGQFVELVRGTGQIVLPFNAGEVNLVAKPGPSGEAVVTVLLDGQPIGDERGADVSSGGLLHVDRPAMFRLVGGATRDDHQLTLITSQPGLRAYAFTFGP